MASQYIHVLIPKSYDLPYTTRVTIDFIKDFETERLSWTIRMSPKCNHKCPYERKEERDVTTEQMICQKQRDVKMLCCLLWRRRRSREPTNARTATLEAGNCMDADSSHQPSEGGFTVRETDLGFLASRTIREILCCFKLLNLWLMVTTVIGI